MSAASMSSISSAYAGAAACTTSKPAVVRIVGMGGYSHHAFTSWVARTNITAQGFDGKGNKVSACGMKINFKDDLGFTASCTTPVVEGGRACQITRGYGNNVASTQWTSVSVEHAGVTHTQQVCKLTANRPAGWFGTKGHSNFSCAKR